MVRAVSAGNELPTFQRIVVPSKRHDLLATQQGVML
jgi:hypothetical protein